MEPQAQEIGTDEKDRRYITFQAYRPRKAMPVTLRPMQDSTGKIFTGQGKYEHWETLTPEEKATLMYIVTPDTKMIIDNGTTLDLNDPITAINWKWAQKHPYIAMNYEKGTSSRDAVYYVIDKKAEAERRVKSTKDADIARYKLREELSPEKRNKAAEALGLTTAKSFSETEVLDWLLLSCDTPDGASAVLAAIDPKNAEHNSARTFFNNLVFYKVIDKGNGGIWLYGSETDGVRMGHTNDTAIDWLLDRTNADMVRVMKARLASIKKVSEGVGAEEVTA